MIDPVPTSPEPKASPDATRRSFHVAAIYGLMSLITAALGLPALLYLLVPAKIRRQNDWVEAGDITQVPHGTPVEMTFRRLRVDGWKVSSQQDTVWVVKTAQNQITAFSPTCTHLGCPYHWDEGKKEFVCPCHDSLFAADGRVIGGPAPRPLDRYATKLEGNKLLLGPIERSQEASA